MYRINEVLLTANEVKERVISDLKKDIIDKNECIDKMLKQINEAQQKVEFYQKHLGEKNMLLFESKYKQFKKLSNESKANYQRSTMSHFELVNKEFF